MPGGLGQTYANAGTDLKGQILLRGKRFKDSLTDIFNKIRAITLHKCSKFITAQPENDVAFPKHFSEDPAKYLQCSVPGSMAVGIINTLEVIKVKEKQRLGSPFGANIVYHGNGGFSIIKTCQSISGCFIFKLMPMCDFLIDITHKNKNILFMKRLAKICCIC